MYHFSVQSGEHPIATSSTSDVVTVHIVFPDGYASEPVVHATVKQEIPMLEDIYLATVCDTTTTGFTVAVRRITEFTQQRGIRVFKPWTPGLKVFWSARPFDENNGRVTVESARHEKHTEAVLINITMGSIFNNSQAHVVITPHCTTSAEYNDNIAVQIKEIYQNRIVALARRVSSDVRF
jgi:hypothetical protein